MYQVYKVDRQGKDGRVGGIDGGMEQRGKDERKARLRGNEAKRVGGESWRARERKERIREGCRDAASQRGRGWSSRDG